MLHLCFHVQRKIILGLVPRRPLVDILMTRIPDVLV